jgi:hypothetical protein
MAKITKLMTILGKNKISEDERHGLVYNFTNGRTQSVKNLTAGEIEILCKTFETQNNALLDKKRKRVLAAIFGFQKKMNKPANMILVKGIACRAAQCKQFNEIPSARLDTIYNAFLKAQKDLDFAGKLVNGFILESQNYN